MTAPLDAQSSRRPRRVGRVIKLLTVIVLILVIGSWWALDRRAAHRLELELGRWRAAGLPIAVEDLYPAKLGDAENGAVALGRAGLLVVETLDPMSDTGGFGRRPWSARVVSIVSASVERNRAALAEARRLRHYPKVYWDPTRLLDGIRGESRELGVLHFKETRALAGLLEAAAELRHWAGDDAEALQHVLDLHDVNRVLSEEPSELSQLIGAGIEALGVRFVQEEAFRMNLDGAAAKTARVLIGVWLSEAGGEGADRRVRCLARESVIMLRWQRGETNNEWDQIVRSFSGEPNWWERVMWHALRPQRIETTAVLLGDLRRQCEGAKGTTYTEFIAAAGAPVRPPTRLVATEPMRTLVQGEMPAFGDYRRFIHLMFEHRAQKVFAAINLAARLYAMDHDGESPPTLAALVPTYLPRVPVDPFDPNGGPMRYVGLDRTAWPFAYSLSSYPDLVASGKFLVQVADDMNWRKSLVVSHLDPVNARGVYVSAPAGNSERADQQGGVVHEKLKGDEDRHDDDNP